MGKLDTGMKRLISYGGLILVLCLLLWFWPRGPQFYPATGEAVPGHPESAPSDGDSESTILQSPTGLERRANPVEDSRDINSEGQGSRPHSRASGLVSFIDGSIPPPLSLEFSLYDPETDRRSWVANPYEHTGECHPRGYTDTDQSGRFEVGKMCAGHYQVSANRPETIRSEGLFEIPSDSLHVVLPGYFVMLRAAGPDSAPLAQLHCMGRYLRDGTSDYPDPKPVDLIRTTNQDGYAYFWLPDPGDITVEPLGLGDDVQSVIISVRSTPGVVKAQLSVQSLPARADLRINLISCAADSAAIHDYCFRLHDLSREHIDFYRCSEDASDRDLFKGLPPGRYLLHMLPRFSDTPVYYKTRGAKAGPVVTLEADKESVVSFCLPLGGRLQLLARSSRPKTEGAQLQVRATLLDENREVSEWLNFRQPLPTGLYVDQRVPVGVERLSEDVIEPGEYVLRIVAENHQSMDMKITLSAGEATRVAVDLQPLE